MAARTQFARRGQARLLAAVVILGAWGSGLTLLVRREFYQGRPQRLAEAALRLSPTATYFAVEQGGKVIGFASSTIDTLTNGVDAIDYFVADFPVGDADERTSKRSVVHLSRGLTLRAFDTQLDAKDTSAHVGGRAEGDSAIVFAKSPSGAPSDSQRVTVSGPVMLPALVPIALTLAERPKVGKSMTLPTLDPATMTSGSTGFTINAESLFTLVDSAKFDEDKGEWVSALTDTVRAWRVESSGPGTFSGWIDAQGRVVQAVQPGGITLRRIAYEIAFENWRIARDRRVASRAGTGDILESTVIAGGAKIGRARLMAMTVQLGAPNLAGFELDGGRQRFRGDTLRVVRERTINTGPDAVTAVDRRTSEFRKRFRVELAGEPLLQAHDREMITAALRIVGLERDPKAVVQKLTDFVRDSMTSAATYGVPNALSLLRTRRGDVNEHAQLFVSLARALGYPARIASGLLYVNGKFYYHAWAEVWLGEWVAVDPTLGQFPADAAHLRFALGGYGRQNDLVNLMGHLKIKVLEAK